jgi:hypothetical protein
MQSTEIDISCLGYSQSIFSIHRPDRLCRGREHWIYQPEDTPEETVFRTVISGTTIHDMQIRFLNRGLRCSGKSLSDIASVLFSGTRLIGWVEEGAPDSIPQEACGVELYQISRPHAKANKWGARYEIEIEPAHFDSYSDLGMDVWVINPTQRKKSEAIRTIRSFPPLVEEEVRGPLLSEDLRNALFLLTGHRNPQNSLALFQPRAISEVLKHCSALVLVHKDKHDICLGIYTQEDEYSIPIGELSEQLSVLMVPFSIPPMLARWDRALKDLHQLEDVEALRPFFVEEETEETDSSSEED